jgi:hydrogenase expression/formation protein HypD
MKFVDEFRDSHLVQNLVRAIFRISRHPVRIMEVCGGHTHAIRKAGLQNILPPNIELLSGPGCPVCVTDMQAIDRAIMMAQIPGLLIATYGDLIRVPGFQSSLNKEKALGADVRIVHSSLQALALARDNPQKQVVFLGIGFETTTPASAVALIEAQKQNIKNFSLLSMHKVMPPAMNALIDQGVVINGFLGPGHVTTIAGSDMYEPLVEKHKIAIAVAGFEPADILQAIYLLVQMIENGEHGIVNQYTRAVTREGNRKAQDLISRCFEPAIDTWRGLGKIDGSGLKIRPEFRPWDAANRFPVEVVPRPESSGCLCGEVLRGMIRPNQCPLFARVCNPSNPVGACMVSGEGACQSYFHFH